MATATLLLRAVVKSLNAGFLFEQNLSLLSLPPTSSRISTHSWQRSIPKLWFDCLQSAISLLATWGWPQGLWDIDLGSESNRHRTCCCLTSQDKLRKPNKCPRWLPFFFSLIWERFSFSSSSPSRLPLPPLPPTQTEGLLQSSRELHYLATALQCCQLQANLTLLLQFSL